MPASIPQVILPYISDLPAGSLSLITAVLNAPANWLVARCILAALQGDQNVSPLERNDTTRASHVRKVVLLSLLRPMSLWTEIGKKAGVDVPNLLAKRRLLYIDGLDIYRASASPDGLAEPFSIRSHALEEVQNVLHRAVEVCYETNGIAAVTTSPATDVHDMSYGPVLVIDGLDFLLASQPELTATVVSQMILSIRQRVHSTILTVSSDEPLLHGNSAAITPLEKEHQALVATLAHQSQIIMQLRGLDMGAARDISGVIRISRGSEYEEGGECQSLAEEEWLYKASNDGVRVWGRGE